jgi:hypothetical protein
MITYINSGNDAKRFNTFALAAKHSLIKKQQAINAQIDYLKSVYSSYVSHYNQLQKLIKEVNDLTGESRYTKVDYSDFPAVDISASFSIKLHNVRLVPEGTSSLRFKNTIEDLRNNFSDLSLSIKSVYNRAMTELSPYGSMKQRTDNIREGASKASTVVGINISTALTEGDLSEEDWSNIKELANAAATAVNTGEGAETREANEAKRKAEEAKKAAEIYEKEQKRLDVFAEQTQEYLNHMDIVVDTYGSDFESCIQRDYEVTDDGRNFRYLDITTGETFAATISISSHTTTQTYTDKYGSSTSVTLDANTKIYTVTKDGEVVGTYNNIQDAGDAFNEKAGRDIFTDDGSIVEAAKKTYEENKQEAIEARNEAQDTATVAAAAADAHRASGTDDSNGGI